MDLEAERKATITGPRVVCSWCQMVMHEGDRKARVSHGICRQCSLVVMATELLDAARVERDGDRVAQLHRDCVETHGADAWLEVVNLARLPCAGASSRGDIDEGIKGEEG